MNMKNMFKISIFGFVLALMLFGTAFSVLTFSVSRMSSDTFHPGSVGTVTVAISNAATTPYAYQDTRLTIYNTQHVHLPSSFNIGNIQPGQTINVNLPIKVDKDTPTGVYTVPISIYAYYVIDGSKKWISSQTTISVPVLSSSNIEISSSGIASDFSVLPFNVSNEGDGEINDLSFYLKGPCYLKDTTNIYMGSLKGSKQLDIPLDCTDAKDGLNLVGAVLSYVDKLNIQHSKTIYTPVYVKKQNSDVNIRIKGNLLSGSSSNINLIVSSNKNNNMNDDTGVHDIRVILNDTNMQISGDDSFYISTFSNYPNNIYNTSLNGYTDLEPGWHYITAYASWIENGSVMKKTFSIPIHVSVKDGVNAYLSDNNPAEEGYTLSVIVSNLESTEVYGVESSIVSPDNSNKVKFIGTTDKYVGSLTSNDFTMVMFNYKVIDPSITSFPVDIVLRFKDVGGDWHTKIVKRTVSISNTDGKGNGGRRAGGILSISNIIVGLIILIIAASILWKYGRKHK